MDLFTRAARLLGQDVRLTFADGTTEDGLLSAVDHSSGMITLSYLTAIGGRAYDSSADYEINGTDNTYAPAPDVPAITAIDPVTPQAEQLS